MYGPLSIEADSSESCLLIPKDTELRANGRDGPEYVIEKLLSLRRNEDGTLYFKSRWADYENHTWESKDCIAE